ncbi:sensor histidine kinase [Arthrobacter flavus]|uniref:histidine kinase n=1 Tax=Arthrobacter flavus TaxID=95172 RepID=A0ABW4Q843_9MICC
MENPSQRRDALIAAITLVCGLLLIGLGLTEVWGNQTGLMELTGDDRWWFALPLAIACVALVYKRRAPVAALAVGFLMLAVDLLLGGSIAILLPFFDLLYTAALICSARVRRALWVIGGVFVAAPMIYGLAETADLRLTVLIGLQQSVMFICPLWWAMDVRRKTELATVAAARADAVERLSLAGRQHAIRQERDSLARDLHDVVASHLSAIALHSGGALATPPDEAKDRAALVQVRRSALESMEDMRTMITLLRAPDSEEIEPVPDGGTTHLPRLTHLQPLLDQAQANGLSVTATDRLSALPTERPGAATELVGYRIVQEALTNAAKHAPGSDVLLEVLPGEGGGDVNIRISNPYPESATPGQDHGTPRGLGLGLISMKERAASIGGVVSSSSIDNHWTVTATLPLTATGTRVLP